MLLVTLVLKTILSISQNGISPITLNKQLGNHLNMDIINASSSLSSFPLVDASSSLCSFLLWILQGLNEPLMLALQEQL
jgi:hypothetical protein